MSSRIVPAESRMEEDSIPEIRLKDESFVPQTNAIKVPSNKYTYRRGVSTLEAHIDEVLKRNGGVSFKFLKLLQSHDDVMLQFFDQN